VLHRREPSTPLAAVGYSLGGNVLLKWLGETGATTPLRAAAAVSVPFLLADSATRLEQGFSRLYQWSLVRRLRKVTIEKNRRRPLPIDVENIHRFRTFRQFDEHVTAPLHGFDGADHYYRVASSRQYLSGIRLPTLILHSRDDPFMTPDTAPAPGEMSASTVLEMYPAGGHVGFVGGPWPWQARYWLEERIPSFLHPLMTGVALPSPGMPAARA
jgi:hypothetical protein